MGFDDCVGLGDWVDFAFEELASAVADSLVTELMVVTTIAAEIEDEEADSEIAESIDPELVMVATLAVEIDDA